MSQLRVVLRAGDLGKFEKRLAGELRAAQQRALHAVGKAAVRMLAFASRDIKDLGTFGAGWRYQAAFNQLQIYNAAPYARWVEFGRKPGKPPPAAALFGWARRKLGDARLAFPVARAIGRRGLRARPVLTAPQQQRAIDTVMQQAMYGAMADAARRAR